MEKDRFKEFDSKHFLSPQHEDVDGWIEVRHLQILDLFKRKPTAKDVYCRHEYDRATKTFTCCKFEDVNFEIYLKPSKKVFVAFEY